MSRSVAYIPGSNCRTSTLVEKLPGALPTSPMIIANSFFTSSRRSVSGRPGENKTVACTCVHESAVVVGADFVGVGPESPTLDSVGLETLDTSQGIVQLAQQLVHQGVVREIARLLQNNVRHAFLFRVVRIGVVSTEAAGPSRACSYAVTTDEAGMRITAFATSTTCPPTSMPSAPLSPCTYTCKRLCRPILVPCSLMKRVPSPR